METLKFGKFKGQKFSETPTWYQSWLLKQNWFKMPIQSASSTISKLSDNLKGWNGHSKNGSAIYDSIFEAEKLEDSEYYNESAQWSSRYDGSY
jgi:hypothetical protein